MADIHNLFGEVNENVRGNADIECMAQALESAARELREGKIHVSWGVFLFEHPNYGGIGSRVIGSPHSVAETIGYLEFYKAYLINGD